MLRHLVGRNYIGWFNLAAAIRVESRKPTGFIVPTIDIEFTRPILLAIRKPFCDTYRVHHACFPYGRTKPNKLFFIWYTSNLQVTMNQCKYQYKCTGTGCTLWTQLRSHLRVYKRASIPAFCFKAKRADELAGELWPDKLYKEPSVWPCWLRIAHLFRPDWCIANPFHRTCEVPSMGLSTQTGRLHQLPRAIRFT